MRCHELPVVQEYASVEAPETSHAKQALRQLDFETLRVTGQYHRRAEEDAVAEQSEPSEQVLRFPAAGLVQPADRTASATVWWTPATSRSSTVHPMVVLPAMLDEVRDVAGLCRLWQLSVVVVPQSSAGSDVRHARENLHGPSRGWCSRRDGPGGG